MSIIIPVLNGQAQVDATLAAVTSHFAGGAPYEVIVVDDGSRDHTPSLVEAWTRRVPEVRMVRLPKNQGKGAAVRAGMQAASGDQRCFFDADLPMPVGELDAVLARLDQGADVVIASRALPGSHVVVQPGWVRRWLSEWFSIVVRGLFRMPYRDTQCGLKGFSRRASGELFSRSRLDGFAFDVELLLLARRLGYWVEEVPVRVENSAPSTVRILTHAPRIARDLWRLAREFHD